MTIHSEHPFAEPPDPVRRFRGRLGGAVSLWTAGAGAERVGLTVSSLMLANGDPARLLGLLDPDADLTEGLLATGRGVVQLLTWADRDLAEGFAGTGPAPGGVFRQGVWEQTTHGPALAGRTRALIVVDSAVEQGWSTLVTGRIESMEILEDHDPLEHRRGRYRQVTE